MRSDVRRLAEEIFGSRFVKATKLQKVFRIRDGLLSRLRGGTFKPKVTFISSMRSTYQEAYISADQWNDDLLDIARQRRWRAFPSGNLQTFSIPQEQDTGELYQVLSPGAWALWFMDDKLDPGRAPNELTIDEETLVAMISRIGATVGVVSFYDDNEWLVAYQ